MCGIAGHVGPTARELLPAMVGLLKHRGPDDSGIHAAGNVGLGMARLAIIDLVTGRQPMSDATERYWVVFNGEIYNFRQLRAELMTAGRRFRTRSDTEVILHAYAVHGEACVERLAGMFAFAIWDDAERRLFLARDRLGKKPLYYWHRDRLFLFASEPKALLCHPAVARSIDWSALHHYLAFGYTPAARSIFDSIRKLPPAHTATFVDGRLTQRRYWQLPAGATSPGPGAGPEESAAAVRAGLREAVRLRLESDVPLGVFLSGGVDSSAVVASMREVTSADRDVFGRSAARRRPTTSCRTRGSLAALPDHQRVLELCGRSPTSSDVRRPSVLLRDSTYVVAQATARHVKVASQESAATKRSAAIRATSGSASRRSTEGSRAGSVTRRARSPAVCPIPRPAGTGPTGRGASPRSPTPPLRTATSAGPGSSATRSSPPSRGPRWPPASGRVWTRSSRAPSPRAAPAIRSTAPSASIFQPICPTISSRWPIG
jgi:hypothetical protein